MQLFRTAISALSAAVLCGCATLAGDGGFDVSQIRVYNSVITNGGSGTKYEEIPTSSVQKKDHVYVVTHLRWNPELGDLGTHHFTWTWYSGDSIVAKRAKDLDMKTTPYRVWWGFQAAFFENGHYRVDVAIDGKVIDSHEFNITD